MAAAAFPPVATRRPEHLITERIARYLSMFISPLGILMSCYTILKIVCSKIVYW
jgi:hypothetical protein